MDTKADANDSLTASENEAIPTPAHTQEQKPTIWVMHCPFRKSGSPVLGTFGYTERGVVIIPIETWTALCREIPALAAKQFNVGSYE